MREFTIYYNAIKYQESRSMKVFEKSIYDARQKFKKLFPFYEIQAVYEF